MKRMSRHTLVALIVGTGFVVASVTLVHDVIVQSGLQQGPSGCVISPGFDCDKVSLSPYSRILGIPVACFAVLFYGALFVFCLVSRDVRSLRKREIFDVLCAASFLSVLATLVFLLISSVLIQSYCLYCMGLYLISFIFAAVVCTSPDRTRPLSNGIVRGIRNTLSCFSFGVISSETPPGRKSTSFVALLGLLGFAYALYHAPAYIVAQYKGPAATEDGAREIISTWRAQPFEEIAFDVTLSPALRDYAQGPSGAPITIVEFSDFECPFCKTASSLIKQAASTFPGKVRVVFKNFPLDSSCNPMMGRPLHQFACQAARAARCAGQQDTDLFWVMHDAIFSLNEITEVALADLSTEIGLDGAHYAACLTDEQTNARIQADIAQGQALAVQGTPAVFLNGRRVTLVRSGTLEVLIQDILG